MTALLYGNLSVEIVPSLGVRVERVTLWQSAAGLSRRERTETPARPEILGREQQLTDALRAVREGLPIGFHAACGYGMTTLLHDIVAVAANELPAQSCVYVRADRDRVEDLLQKLVARLYRSDRPVTLTPDQCAQVLGHVSAVVAVDDLAAGPGQVAHLLDVLPACSVVIGSARPVLGRRGTSVDLPGLPDDSALQLLSDALGRPLRGEELPAARRLVAATDGQPLHLRQAAALVRAGSHSVASLARQAEQDPEVLDSLSVSALAGRERRALAILALAAGALLPPELVDAIGQAASLADGLESLHRRGLAERRDDRFGLPACKAGSYRQMLLGDLQLGASARDLCTWLTTRDPTAAESQSAADAVLAMVEFAAERADWTAAGQLARAVEPVLFIAGRWEAWHETLGRGLDAATAVADKAAEAFFSHQLGSLAFCQDRLEDAVRLLRRALAIREEIGERDGADLSRYNLRQLDPSARPSPDRARPDSARPDRRRATRRRLPRILVGLLSMLGALALVAGGVGIASALRAGGHGQHGPPSQGTSSGGSFSQSSGTGGTSQRSGTSESSGTSTPATVTVPNIIGQTQAEATSSLTSQGLAAAAATTSDCPPKDDGDVVSENPGPGSPAHSGDTISISVCDSASSMVDMLDVVGQTQSQATSTLQGQGLVVTSTSVSECGAGDDGHVVSQSPPAPTAVATGTTVSIGVCIATG